jgi:ketosteroid isomerase-like protein
MTFLRLAAATTLIIATCPPLQGQGMPGGNVGSAAMHRSAAKAGYLRELTVILHDWMQSWKAGDVKALTRLYSADAVVILPNAAEARSGALVASSLADAVAAGGEGILNIGDFVADGELGYVFGSYELRDTAGNLRSRGSHVTVVARERRRWVIRTQMFRPEEG